MQVIMTARLYAMYQGSRTMLIFLVIIFLGVNITCVVFAAIAIEYTVAGKYCLLTCRIQLIEQTPDELILSGMYICGYDSERDAGLLSLIIWVLSFVWEVLALCLSVWIALKHSRDLRRLGPSTGSMIWDCFSVLIQSHVLYFAR
jgi:hypothetical protein